jgi:hypothetical protein
MSDDPIHRILHEIADLRTEVIGLRTEISDIRSEITGLRVALMGRMDKLSDEVTAIRGDIRVNFGALESVRKANDNTREELRALNDVVAQMNRQILHLGERVAGLEQGKNAGGIKDRYEDRVRRLLASANRGANIPQQSGMFEGR